MRESQRDPNSRARTGGTGWPGPLGEVWEAWAGLLLAGKTFFVRFFPTCLKILSLLRTSNSQFPLKYFANRVECRRAIIGAKREDLRVLWEATEDR